MAGIVFFFEDNDIDIFSGRRIDLCAWNYAIKAAGDIDKMIVVNKTGNKIVSPDSSIDFMVCEEIPELDGKIAHMICPWDNVASNNVPIWDFNHDVDWYVFGPASGWDGNSNFKVGVHVPQSGAGALHAVHIASVVMMHRYKVISWQHQS